MNANDVVDRTAKIITDNVAIGKQVVSEMPVYNKPYNSTGSMTMYIIVLVVLTLLGINIFGYAAVVTETFSEIFGPIFREVVGLFGYYGGETIKQTVELSAEGTKFGADIAKDVVVNSVDLVNEQVKNAHDAVNDIDAELIEKKPNTVPITTSNNNTTNNEIKDPSYIDRNALLDSFEKVKQNISNNNNTDFNSDDAGSTIQNGGMSGTQGWCYIGEDRGFRSCAEVGTSHECMSGSVFPSKDLCINPSLR